MVQAVTDGVLRNIGVMAPGAAVDHASEVLAPLPNVAIGLHVTLNSEWDEVRWGPVLSASEVPTLVEADGTFTRSPQVLHDRGFSLDEAMAEVAAQLERLRSVGLRVDYLDEHMGVGWLSGLGDRLRDFARQEGLVYAGDFKYAGGYQSQDLESVVRAVLDGPMSPFAIVFHPLPNVDPVARRFTAGGRMPGEILRERAQDRRVLTDPRLMELVRSGQVESITYVEAAG